MAAGRLGDWIGELEGCKGHELLLVADNRSPDLTERFKEHFDRITLTWVTDDAWNSWPDSANNMFRKGAKLVEFLRSDITFFLWMEPDAVPLVEGWADKLEAEFKEGVKKGKRFMGDKVLVKDVPMHMSGIGVYPSPLSQFAGPAYLAQDIAWDCYAANEIIPKAHFTPLIEHAWKHPPFTSLEELDTQIRKEAVLFHASKDGSLIELLRKRKRGDLVEEEIQEEKREEGNGILTNVLPVPVLAEPRELKDSIEARESAQDATVNADSRGGQPPVTDIFIKTYPQDYEWLTYCLRSLKFCSGFRKAIITTPNDNDAFRDVVVKGLGNLPFHLNETPEYCEDGYLSQQIFKVYADTFTDSDYILHIDSDTIFTCAVTPEMFLVNGKPVWMITPRAEIPNDNPWLNVMRDFMGEEPPYEFMRRFPFLIPNWFYKEFRMFIQGRHRLNADEYIKYRPYKSFSEFNCMGFFAWKFYHDRFHWVDTSKDQWPILTVEQLWSHGELTDEIRERREKILGEINSAQKQGNTGERSTEESRPLQRGDPVLPTFPDQARFHAKALADLASSPYRRQKVRSALREVELIR